MGKTNPSYKEVFLTYKNGEVTNRLGLKLTTALEKANITVYYAIRDLSLAYNDFDLIHKATLVLFLYSEKCNHSERIPNELEITKDRLENHKLRTLITVAVDDRKTISNDLMKYLSGYPIIDYKPEEEDQLVEKLVGICRDYTTGKKQIA